MPRLASITSQSLTGITLPVDSQGNPNPPILGLWTDDNGDTVTVAAIISPVAIQVNGVFAQNPVVPFDIEGVTSGAVTTITNIAANTGTLLELDDNGNSTSFIQGESLTIVEEWVDNNYFAVGTTGWTTNGTGNASWSNGTVTLADTSDGDTFFFYYEVTVPAGTYKAYCDVGAETGNGALLRVVDVTNGNSTTNISITGNQYNAFPQPAYITTTGSTTLQVGLAMQLGGGVAVNACGLVTVP